MKNVFSLRGWTGCKIVENHFIMKQPGPKRLTFVVGPSLSGQGHLLLNCWHTTAGGFKFAFTWTAGLYATKACSNTMMLLWLHLQLPVPRLQILHHVQDLFIEFMNMDIAYCTFVNKTTSSACLLHFFNLCFTIEGIMTAHYCHIMMAHSVCCFHSKIV